MHPLHDKDLDRISREAAEQFEVESGASGWASLEQRLDVELPQKKKKRRFLFWLFFITATTGGALIGIMNYRPLNPIAKNTSGIEFKSGGSKKADAATGRSTTGNYNTPEASSQTATNAQPVSGAQMPGSASTTATTTNVAGNNQPAPVPQQGNMPDKNTGTTTVSNKKNTHKSKLSLNYASITPDNSAIGSAPVTNNSKRKPGTQQGRPTSKHKQTVNQSDHNTLAPDTKQPVTDQQVATNEPGQNVDNTAAQQSTAPTADAVKQEATTVTAATDSAKAPVAPVTKKEPEQKQDKKVKGLELGLMAGPDLSSVKFGPIYKTGYNFGVQIGYRFTNRWSVNTGVIYTKKFYQADSQDFHYKMPWPNYRLKDVEGNCSMWEIPVNVRYDVSFNDKRRWFVSTGLSTYLMDKENYTVYYYTWSGNVYDSPVSTDINSNYIFSIVNLSAGMERSLGKHLSIQAEPYLKIPLQGLGMGDMRMTSYGAIFTLKYKPQFNFKRSDNRK